MKMFLENGKSIVKQRLALFEEIAKRNYQYESLNKTRTSLQNLLDIDEGLKFGIANEFEVNRENQENFERSESIVETVNISVVQHVQQQSENGDLSPVPEKIYSPIREKSESCFNLIKDEIKFSESKSLPENLHKIGKEDQAALEKYNEDKIWAQIDYTIKELLNTEQKYLDSLHDGITRTGSLVVKDVRYIIEAIYDFHINIFNPLLQSYENDPKALGQLFTKCIADNQFYGYIDFGLHMPEINMICKNRRSRFDFNNKKSVENDMNSCIEYVKLPMKRLPQYVLLMHSIWKTIDKISHKSQLNKEIVYECMEAERAVNKIISLMDRALDFKNLYFERKKHLMDSSNHGRLLNIEDFDILETGRNTSYKGKIFLFEKILIYTKFNSIRKKYVYQGHFKCVNLIFRCDALNRIYARGRDSKVSEIQFCGKENNFKQWVEDIRLGIKMSTEL